MGDSSRSRVSSMNSQSRSVPRLCAWNFQEPYEDLSGQTPEAQSAGLPRGPSKAEKRAESAAKEADRASTCGDTASGEGENQSDDGANSSIKTDCLSLIKAASNQEEKVLPSQQTGNVQQLKMAVLKMLKALPKEACSKEVLENTPRRVAEALMFFTKGYNESVKDVVGSALYEVGTHQELIAVKDLDVNSICEHHLLPFSGKCHIVYLPGRYVMGFSKFPRILQVFDKRLQMQERLTGEVAQALMEVLCPQGVLVMMECTHACMSMRVVGCKAAKTTTLAYHGVFREDAALRREALSLIR